MSEGVRARPRPIMLMIWILESITRLTFDCDPVAPLDRILEMFRAILNAGLWVMLYATHVTVTNTWQAEMFAL